ncbi:uncharacterized protein LOC125524817 isoform X2 [Triticum urartu]|uniref:uncharacterized protein LOC125524817 isoform X2 n=1 Tax=Triticum urartu TaxID=4572 RepID=UPI0020443675|nr:uncharacterized protein LOC125524817 isoform X2 [Triticum urartu]
MCADVPPPAPSHRRRHHRPDLHHGPSHHLVAGASSRAELWEESLRKATELAQAVANALFSLPATEGCDGPVVRLPPPTNRLPREKHLRILHPVMFQLQSAVYPTGHYYVSMSIGDPAKPYFLGSPSLLDCLLCSPLFCNCTYTPMACSVICFLYSFVHVLCWLIHGEPSSSTLALVARDQHHELASFLAWFTSTLGQPHVYFCQMYQLN